MHTQGIYIFLNDRKLTSHTNLQYEVTTTLTYPALKKCQEKYKINLIIQKNPSNRKPYTNPSLPQSKGREATSRRELYFVANALDLEKNFYDNYMSSFYIYWYAKNNKLYD